MPTSVPSKQGGNDIAGAQPAEHHQNAESADPEKEAAGHRGGGGAGMMMSANTYVYELMNVCRSCLEGIARGKGGYHVATRSAT